MQLSCSRRRGFSILATASLAAMLSVGSGVVFAQAGGSSAASVALPKTVRVVVSYPAGGVSDVVARLLAERLAARTGSQFIVENKAGASGSIGVDQVAKSTPDGSVLSFASTSPLVLTPLLGKPLFDPFKDVQPVVSVMYSPVVLLATSASKATSFANLLDDAKKNPGAIRWATSGPASLGHIMLEQLKAATNVDITHVPYKGGGQQMNDALGGHFEILSTNAGPAVDSQIKAGKLRPLAVGAPSRLPSLKDVPTLGELGFANANLSSSFGIYAPAGVPKPMVERLNREINTVLAEPDVRQRLIATDNVPAGGSAEAFAKQIRDEYKSNEAIIRKAGIKAD